MRVTVINSTTTTTKPKGQEIMSWSQFHRWSFNAPQAAVESAATEETPPEFQFGGGVLIHDSVETLETLFEEAESFGSALQVQFEEVS